MYVALDISFFVFHGTLVIFNTTGWIWERTRKLHLVTIGLTILSWFGLGLFYGWGYCPSTDWHWDVKRKLGETDLPNSYIKYYMDGMTGLSWDPTLVNTSVLFFGVGALFLSVWLNWRDWKRRSIDGAS